MGGIVCVPEFAAGDAGTDWNDLAAAQGADAVRAAFVAALQARETAATVDATPDAEAAPERQPEAKAQDAADSGELRPRFVVNARGVFWCDVEYGKRGARELDPLFLCSPIKIEAVGRDLRGYGWARLLSFTDLDGAAKQWMMPSRLLAGGKGDELRAALLDAGLPEISLEPRAQKQLMRYFMCEVPTARVRQVRRTGWHGNAYVMPGHAYGDTQGERYFLRDDDGADSPYEKAGTLEDWRTRVAKPCGEHSRALFAMACAFAGPLLQLVGGESGGFNLVGGSASGKTTALRLASSVWGQPDQYWRQWRATSNGMEAIADEFNDCLLGLDEMGEADPKDVGGVAYMMGNGRGKQRADQRADARKVKTFRVMLLSTGEVGTAAMMNAAGQKSRAGHEVRLVEVPADAQKGFGLWSSTGEHATAGALAAALLEAARQAYGQAGQAFVQRAAAARVKIADEGRRRVADFVDYVCPTHADGQVRRVAARFGLVTYAGELATEYGLTGWDRAAVEKAIVDAFQLWLHRRGTAGAQEPAQMVAQVRAFIELNGSAQFQDITPHASGVGYAAKDDPEYRVSSSEVIGDDVMRRVISSAGYRKKDKGRVLYLVKRERFRKDVCEGFDVTAVCNALVAANILLCDKGRFTKNYRTPDSEASALPYYILDGDALMREAA